MLLKLFPEAGLKDIYEMAGNVKCVGDLVELVESS